MQSFILVLSIILNIALLFILKIKNTRIKILCKENEWIKKFTQSIINKNDIPYKL